ncbi:MAG: nucleotidyl transferase AbiEii/AbiGii toxin family protein, partial [Pseudomonadota bacterium]
YMIAQLYRSQVELLLDILPYVQKENCFALKGGTAINLFIWEMPRLSVDIDLTYLTFDDRNLALMGISEAILRIKDSIVKNLPSVQVEATGITASHKDKLICNRNGTKIKIEVNTTMRGSINPPILKQMVSAVRKEFDKFAAMWVISNAEIFGGKICAALDRQHPRDLFDIHQLFNAGGVLQKKSKMALLLHCLVITDHFMKC